MVEETWGQCLKTERIPNVCRVAALILAPEVHMAAAASAGVELQVVQNATPMPDCNEEVTVPVYYQ